MQFKNLVFGSFTLKVVETEMGHAIVHEDSGTTTISFYGYEGWEFVQKYSCGDEPWKTDTELFTGICQILGTAEAIPTWETKRIG